MSDLINYSELEQAIASTLDDSIVDSQPARLGNPTMAAGTDRINVPLTEVDTPGMVYIYGIESDPQAVSMALNSGKGQVTGKDLVYGAFIRVKRVGRQWYVDGVDAKPQAEYLYGVTIREQSRIVLSQFDLGLLQPTTPTRSMKAVVSGAIYYKDNLPYMVAAQETHDFTSDVPGTTGQAKAVLVTINPVTGALAYTVGSAFDMTLSHISAFSFYPQNNDNSLFTVGWVKLINGMTAIFEGAHILSAQELLNKNTGSSGATGVGEKLFLYANYYSL